MDKRVFERVSLINVQSPSKSSSRKTANHENQEDHILASSTSFHVIKDHYRKLVIAQETGTRDLRQWEASRKGHNSADLGSEHRDSVADPVKVDDTIMSYIHKSQLERIKERHAVSIDRQGGFVVFSPSNCIQAQFAREQFITLYQKAATRLQIMTWAPNTQHQTPNKTNQYDTPRSQSVKQQKSTDQANDETCPICLEPIKTYESTILPKCKHSFCKDCLKRAFELKPACPICGEIYGNLTGTQPKGGTMTVSRDGSSLPGYERYGTIVISYYIPNGVQGDEHPNSGAMYQGASRIAYIPDSPEGNRVLKLLQRAFDQRLTFTIGRSSTTGRNNVVTWNDIHHKTSRTGGPTHYGYPDPHYLNRVQDELKAKGIY